MVDFGALILGHLVGDYLWQTDWMASKKTSSSFVCAVHCCTYTLAVFIIVRPAGSTWPWWAYGVVALAHFPLDRWRLASKWMQYSGHKNFAKALAPWSTIMIDNIMHLLVLYVLFLGLK